MKVLIQVLTVIILLASCSNNNNSPIPPADNNILPLKVGNSWTYTTISYSQNGQIQDSGTLVETVASTKLMDGKTFFRITDNLGGELSFRNEDDKTVQIDDDNSVSIFFKIVDVDSTKYLTEPWQVNNCTGQALKFGFTGSFNFDGYDCLKNEEILVNCNGEPDTKYIYYVKPGIGLIKWDEYLYINNGSALYHYYSQDIRSYSLH